MRPLVIWRYCDGLRGHENQTAGLVDALKRRVPVKCTDVTVSGRFGGTNAEPGSGTPDLLLGAGHRTHRALVSAGSRTRGKTILLMRPTGPTSRFDLCVIPEHDSPVERQEPGAPAVLSTRGVLNRVTPATGDRQEQTLVAIGGPSRHHDWLGAEVVAQVAALSRRASELAPVVVTNSRRTPTATWGALGHAGLPHTTLVDWQEQDAGWLVREMSTARTVWVTEDSVSMVYEALSSGAGVGLLAVPRRRVSRVLRGVAGLISDGSVTLFDMWRRGSEVSSTNAPLAEADRIADWIIRQWLNVA